MPRVALVGFMAVGKTTTGRLLAEALGLPFVDLDQSVEARENMTVPQLFARSEATFRAAEALALAEALAGPDCVIGCGGGAPCQPGAMDALLGWGTVVHLDAPLEVLRSRAGGGEGRPLWAQAEALLARRRPVYDRAHLRVDATLSPSEQVDWIRRAL